MVCVCVCGLFEAFDGGCGSRYLLLRTDRLVGLRRYLRHECHAAQSNECHAAQSNTIAGR